VRLLLALAAAVVVAGLVGCRSPSTAPAVDQDAAQAVQAYFAGDGARYVQGLLAKDIEVTDQVGGQRLSVLFVGDGSSRAEACFSSLYYMATSDDGWIADLNKKSLSIAWVAMAFDYGDGSAHERLTVDVARRRVAGSTRLRPGPPTTARP
jgi:hypothetical protein